MGGFQEGRGQRKGTAGRGTKKEKRTRNKWSEFLSFATVSRCTLDTIRWSHLNSRKTGEVSQASVQLAQWRVAQECRSYTVGGRTTLGH